MLQKTLENVLLQKTSQLHEYTLHNVSMLILNPEVEAGIRRTLELSKILGTRLI